MRAAQLGDRVVVHYVARREDGSATSSRDRNREPLALTVGVDHPRLPGLGASLVGLAPGDRLTVHVPAERAYGLSDPARVHRWARTRFPDHAVLNIGKWILVQDRRGRRHLVRVEAVSDRVVVFDANRRSAGQALKLDIELLTVEAPDTGPARGSQRGATPLSVIGPLPGAPPRNGRVIAIDPDPASVAGLRQGLPGWRLEVISGATADSFPCDWHPGAASLLVVHARADSPETWDLCRFLASCTSLSDGLRRETTASPARRWRLPNEVRRADIPLLVLVPAGQGRLIRLALAAGAHHGLVLPITARGMTAVLVAIQADRPPRLPGLRLFEAPDGEDRWADDGGRG